MDTDSFVMHIKTNDFYKNISDDVDNRFDTSNYEVKRPLPIGKNKKSYRINEIYGIYCFETKNLFLFDR